MSNKQRKVDLQKFKDSQNLNDKSKLLRVAFAVHNRHMSSGAIKEVINSKPNIESFETFKEIIDELEFELVEFQISKKLNRVQSTIWYVFLMKVALPRLQLKGLKSLHCHFPANIKLRLTKQNYQK